jgi:hypothetical protein
MGEVEVSAEPREALGRVQILGDVAVPETGDVAPIER